MSLESPNWALLEGWWWGRQQKQVPGASELCACTARCFVSAPVLQLMLAHIPCSQPQTLPRPWCGKTQCKDMLLHIGSAIVSSCTALMWLHVHTWRGPETCPAAPVEGTADEEHVEVESDCLHRKHVQFSHRCSSLQLSLMATWLVI